ncbi:ABC transporter substrate-binding protein [Aliiroseovarius sp. Z3]|uniref:ABC transporter substrate-binding protein n=1 Tax=Aliiroseovarius sp. Z3 TaxID=2811402 RepID=UPI0023B2C64D|nr:ABC transporter substrate-binding protein [Aliiroseovarius sp. Z3]MDE9450061.1 ABC transporter substrate-binding protein [Aliiroseovarius sp. Z3]
MSKELEYLSKQFVARKLSRRHFMGRAAALGMTAAGASTMLSSAVYAQGPVKGGTIRVGLPGGSTTDSLDPATTTNTTGTMVSRLWGEPLVELAPHGGLEYKLAEEVTASTDAKVWTFKIRSGVQFSNGKTLTADDVLATMERHAGEDTKSGALGIMRGITGMSVDGDKFIVELETPNADLPYLMTDYHLMIQPDGGKENPAAAIGTGPYILKDVDMGVRFVAEKNPNYWGDLGHADSIEVVVINDDTARMAAIQSGQVDLAARVPPRTADLVARAPNINVYSTPGPGHYVFIAHCNTAPFDNNDLRLALKYGINREEMVEKILFGYGSIGNDTPINSSYPLFTEMEQRTFDPDKAKFHFDKSGHDGAILLRTSDNSFPGAPDASALFQQSMATAGITLDIKREPNDGYWSEVWNAQPFCTSYWSGRPTQDQMYSTAYLSTADWNDTRFFNEQFDQLLLAARGELDEAKRTQMYADMGSLVHNEGGLICPMFNDFIDGTTNRVAGWVENHKGFDMMNMYAPMKMWVVG